MGGGGSMMASQNVFDHCAQMRRVISDLIFETGT